MLLLDELKRNRFFNGSALSESFQNKESQEVNLEAKILMWATPHAELAGGPDMVASAVNKSMTE